MLTPLGEEQLVNRLCFSCVQGLKPFQSPVHTHVRPVIRWLAVGLQPGLQGQNQEANTGYSTPNR